MNFRNLSAWSIRNPVAPIVVFAALVLLGLVSFLRMEVQDQPDVEFPMVIVVISQPGAAPKEIETQITQRIEAAVRSIAGVSSISSTATEGSSQTQIEFQIGSDINAAVSEVKNAIDQERGNLPDGILEPEILKANTSGDPIAYFAASADDMSIEQLSWFIDNTIAKRLLSVNGMAEVKRQGGVNREIMVTLDPARMQAYGVTAPADQPGAARAEPQCRRRPGRDRRHPPVGARARQCPGRLCLVADADPAGHGPLGQAGRCGDRDGRVRRDHVAGQDERPPGGHLFDGPRARRLRCRGLRCGDGRTGQGRQGKPRAALRPAVLAFYSVEYTKQQYDSSMSSMVEGAVLAVIVVFFFLRDWRATLVSAIAIPLSAIPTFWFMKSWFGFTLNQLSLLALGLVAGVLVDDAIVEIENIVRHMRMGKTAYQAAIDASDEIGLAVVATTFSIVAVFLPVGLMPGVSGQFFKNFGLTVVVSVLMSLLVARMITPMVAAYFLKAQGHAEHAGGPMMDRYLRVLYWSLDTTRARAYRAARAARGRLGLSARWCAAIGGPAALVRLVDRTGTSLAARWRDHRIWMMGTGILALAATVVLFISLPIEFFPDSNSDFTSVTIDMVPGTTVAQTGVVADRVAALVSRQPEIDHVLENIREGHARLFVTLHKQRARKTTAIERGPDPHPATDRRCAGQLPVVVERWRVGDRAADLGDASGSDSVLLEATAATLVNQMKGIKDLVAPRISGDLKRPEVEIRPRLDLAATMGVSTSSLSQAIRIATIGEIDQNAAKFSLADRQIPIRVRLPENARRTIGSIANLPVPTVNGGSVPLSRVAEISFGSGATSIERYNQDRRVFIGADLAPGVVKGHRHRQDQRLADHAASAGRGIQYRVRRGPLADRDARQHQPGGAGRDHAGLRGAGAALSPHGLADGQHGLAVPRAAGRAARAAADRATAVDAGIHRFPDAAGHRCQEFDPAHRFRHRGNGARRRQVRCHHRGPGTSGRSRSS